MVLARWQSTITDEEGNVLAGALVTIRREVAGSPLATIYTDRDGLVTTGNPITADSEGYVYAHLVGGAYRITATSGGFSKTWRYVAVGLGAETDSINVGVGFTFDTGVNDADPGTGAFRFNNSTPGLASKMFISQSTPESLDVAAWLATWDDGGSAANRGQLIIQSASGGALMVAMVTGSVTDDGLYFDVPITVIASTAADTFLQDVRFGITFVRAGTDGTDGADGTGTVNGPFNLSPGITTGEIAVFSDTSGDNIDGSGRTISTVGAGKQTVYIPAGSMTRQTTNPPAILATTELATNDIMLSYLAFDATTAENAQFDFPAPKGLNEAYGVTFRVRWSHGSTTTNFGVAWQLEALARSDDDAMDTSMTGTGIVVTDTGGTTDDLYITSESTAVMPVTFAEGDHLFFRISRQPGNASDTMAVDARLIGVEVFVQYAANTDD